MAARLKIIILDKERSDIDGNTFNCVMWADVPAARQTRYANPNATSAWSGAQTGDTDQLKSGAVVEEVVTQRVPPGSSMAQMQAFMQARWQDFQNYITNFNPWNRYGSTWDGTTWTMTNNG